MRPLGILGINWEFPVIELRVLGAYLGPQVLADNASKRLENDLKINY